MEQNIQKFHPRLEEFIALEKEIWEAFRTGDMKRDANMLSDDFLGIYTDGNLNKQGHYLQLENGPMVVQYEFKNEAVSVLPDGQVELSYRAHWVRVGGDLEKPEVMDVWSKWKSIDGQWKNTESRDVPVVT